MSDLVIAGLPDDPLAAATVFHDQWLPVLQPMLAGDDIDHVTLIFPAADYCHRAWRLAAVQQLARTHAPIRVNAVCGAQPVAAITYLATAPGVTGQVLEV